MKILIALFLLSACASAPPSRPPLSTNADYGSISGSVGDVIVIPQWHLSPSTMTTLSSAGLPQSENQRAIFRQLVDWIESGRVKTVIVEGCEGEIANGFTERYNGWTLADLEKLSAEQLDNVMTQIGIKLKAKVGRKARIVCGDKLELVKKHQLILSDIRGLMGFRVRIEQYKDDLDKRADYVATVRDLMKLPPTADEDDVLAKLDANLQERMQSFKTVLQERDSAFVAEAKRADLPAAIVIGAIHEDDLDSQLESAKIAVQVFTSRGLKGDEQQVLNEVSALLSRPMTRLPKERREKPATTPPRVVQPKPVDSVPPHPQQPDDSPVAK